MNQINPIVLFKALVELKHLNGKAKSDAIATIISISKVYKANNSICANNFSDAYVSASKARFSAIELRAAVTELKRVIFANAKSNRIDTQKSISILTRTCNHETKSLVSKIEKVATNAEASAIRAKSMTKALEMAFKATSHANDTFVRGCLAMANPKTSVLAKALTISISNFYANIIVNSLLRYGQDPTISLFLEKITDPISRYINIQVHLKKRAWDIGLIIAFAQSLAEIFPEEWHDWQHWISDMMDSRTRMQSKGMNHRLISLIIFYRLTRFVWHIGIDKVFILATRRDTR